MLHQEADGIARFTATEALIDLLGRGDGEGGRLLIMEWTKTQVVGAPFLQFHKPTDDLDDIDAVLDLLYGFLRNHGPCKLSNWYSINMERLAL